MRNKATKMFKQTLKFLTFSFIHFDFLSAETIMKASANPKRKGPNPLESILKADD